MKNKKIIVLLAVIVFLVQAACGIGDIISTAQAPQVPPTVDVGNQIATGIALTQAAQPPTNPIVPPVQPPANPIVPPPAQSTITPEVPTFTAVPSVQGSVNYGANCRTGPGANFPNVMVYEQGTIVNIIGTNLATDKTTWWLANSLGQTDCWMINEALTISGDKSSVGKVASPPTPTPIPAPNWIGTWTYWIRGGFSGAADQMGTVVFTQTGNSLYGTFNQYNAIFTVTGTVSADGMSVYGDLLANWGGSWAVVLKRNPSNINQFRGSWSNRIDSSYDGDWCGAIMGAGKPSPCRTH